MKSALKIFFIICSNICFSQTEDTAFFDATSLSKDKSFEMSISAISPGLPIYTSELKNNFTKKSYFNMFHFGFCGKNISVNFQLNLLGHTATDTFNFKNQHWPKGKELVTTLSGLNISYAFHISERISVKPFAGIAMSNYYLTTENESDPKQNSKTGFCGQFGINSEYRFKPKRVMSYTDEFGNKYWNNQYWSIQLQTGILPSVFKNTTGFNGNLFYFAIGGSYNIGTYAHLKK